MYRGNRIKEVVLGDHTFKIKEFTPNVACFWAFRLFGTVTGAMLGESDAIGKFINMQRSDFNALMLDALSVVMVEMPSGVQPFYREDGGYSISDVQNTLVFELVVEAFTNSIAPFLSKDLIARLQKSLAGTFPTIGLSDSSTPQ